MGLMSAVSMVELEGPSDLALTWHLTSNHYPPLPISMVPVCKAAIEAGNDEDWDREIDLPEGITFRDRPTAPAHEVISTHHLEAFLD